ncbi:MAG: DUF4384 domain-containing protein [Pseudomonadota bacterium]|nr:DUF4384 domain-containing protein [Pseudomonadota bacterium]
MLRSLLCLWLMLPLAAFAGVSEIVEETGTACRADGNAPPKNRQQTELDARTDAKRSAAERVATRIKSETRYDTVEVKNEGQAKAYQVGKVLRSAYANADVKELAVLETGAWDAQDACFRIKLRVEVIPKAEALETLGSAMQEDPTLPLNVQLWTDRSTAGERAMYRKGELVRLYLRGNKPYYARVIYQFADGQRAQILPNAHRSTNRFQGGVTYVIPSEEDSFDFEVSAPFGAERVVVYASERPLGEISLQASGSIYRVEGGRLESQVRDVKLDGGAKKDTAAFSEYAVELITMP